MYIIIFLTNLLYYIKYVLYLVHQWVTTTHWQSAVVDTAVVDTAVVDTAVVDTAVVDTAVVDTSIVEVEEAEATNES